MIQRTAPAEQMTNSAFALNVCQSNWSLLKMKYCRQFVYNGDASSFEICVSIWIGMNHNRILEFRLRRNFMDMNFMDIIKWILSLPLAVYLMTFQVSMPIERIPVSFCRTKWLTMTITLKFSIIAGNKKKIRLPDMVSS